MTKVLIAEDDKFLANAYRVKLTKAGFDVKIVSDGDETLTALSSFVPDIVILDLVMPKRDGFVVLGEMKKNPSWTKIPCIVASNLGQKEDVQKAMSLGASDYIVKSDFSLSKLVDKINASVKK